MFEKHHSRHVFSKIVDIASVTKGTDDVRQTLSTGEEIGLVEHQRGQMARIPAKFFVGIKEVGFEDLPCELQYLLIEYYQLQERIERFSPLMSGLEEGEKEDRRYQAVAMGNYRYALQKRIKRLTGELGLRQHLTIS